MDVVTLAAAKKYTDKSIAGGGAIKGKNCVVESIDPITGGNRVTFKWTLDDGTVQRDTMDVMDGAQGPQGEKGDDGTVISVDPILSAGTKIAVIYVDDVPVELYAPSGGSGSGGHTIKNSGGVAFPQRSNLKFGSSFTVSDDANGDATIIGDTYDEISWDDWNAMTPAQQDQYKQDHPSFIITGAPDLPVYDALNKLLDVQLTNLTNGQILKYNATTNKWENVNAGGGGGTSDYKDLVNKPSINNVTLEDNLSTDDLLLNDGDTIYVDDNGNLAIGVITNAQIAALFV